MKKISSTENRKKIIIIALTAVLCLCVAAGVFSAVKKNNKEEKESVAGSTVIASEQTGAEQNESGGVTQNAGSPSAAKESTQNKKEEERSRHSGNENTDAEKTASSGAYDSEQSENTASDGEITVTVIINSKNAADYFKSNPELNREAPEFLVQSAAYTAKEGATVFDALEAVCSENGLSLEYEKKTYIRGIGGIKEKDCGGSSGWTYRVNGRLIMAAASKSVLNDGDRVEWIYVTNSNQ